MLTLYIIGFVFGAFYLLWVLFLATMAVWRAELENKLSKPVYYFAIPAVLVGWLLDTFLNWVVLSLIFWEWPKEHTVSERLRRINESGRGWKRSFAQAFEPLLDPFDPTGKHI